MRTFCSTLVATAICGMSSFPAPAQKADKPAPSKAVTTLPSGTLVKTVKRVLRKGKCVNTLTLLEVQPSMNAPVGFSSIAEWLQHSNAKVVAEAQQSIRACEGGGESETTYTWETHGPRIFVIHCSSSEYMEGAAHGMYHASAHVWDVQEGQLFDPNPFKGNVAALNRIIRSYLNRINDNNEFESIVKHAPAGWNPGKKGIHLWWNPYQIGPFSDGAYDIEIPIVDLRPHLKPEIAAALR